MTTLTILSALTMALAVAVLACAALQRKHATRSADSQFLDLENIAEGVHANGEISVLTDAAITTRHLLYKDGSDDQHVAVCGASDIPLGAIEDEASAAEERVAMRALGSKPGTMLMVASEAITRGEHVYTAAAGKVSDLSAVAATYYEVGVALTAAAADGDLIEVAHCVPRATIVT